MESSKREFVPDRFGMLLWQMRSDLAILIVLTALSWLVFSPLLDAFGELLRTMIPVFIGLMIGSAIRISAFCKSYAVAIQAEYISGPSRWLGKTVIFKLRELDRAKTNRQKMFHRLFGYRLLVSVNDEVILLAEQAFNKPDLKDLQGLLDLETPSRIESTTESVR